MSEITGKSLSIWAKLARIAHQHGVPSAHFYSVSRTQGFPRSANVRRGTGVINSNSSSSLAAAMTTSSDSQLDAIFEKKRSLRTQIRKQLRSMSPAQRSEEDIAIQNIVLEAPWFKSSHSLCAYVSCDALREVNTSRILSRILSKDTEENCERDRLKRLYLPRIEDRNSNMKMLRVESYDDLISNSMNILEPSPVYPSGDPREEAMLVDDPIDLFILPGLAFDRAGRRLGRSGGYYDTYLRRYQELAKERKWKQPLLVALAYSVQIVEEEAIPVTSNDFPVDAIVSPAGVISINTSL